MEYHFWLFFFDCGSFSLACIDSLFMLKRFALPLICPLVAIGEILTGLLPSRWWEVDLWDKRYKKPKQVDFIQGNPLISTFDSWYVQNCGKGDSLGNPIHLDKEHYWCHSSNDRPAWVPYLSIHLTCLIFFFLLIFLGPGWTYCK